MPTAKSKRAIRKERRDKKKTKSDNYRKGGRPIHFDFFCKNRDLDVLVREKLAEIEGRTDEDSQWKREELEDILSALPTKIPSREGLPPIEGERDHYYLRFFHYLTNRIERNAFYKILYRDFRNDTERYIRHSWRTCDMDMRENLMYVNYLDHGPDHPGGARKPPARRRVLKHIKHMQAKRAKTEAAE
jgi:hypothetical protein